MIKRHIITLILALSALTALTAAPQGRHGRPYTEADPLVMVCDWSFPPYELNKNGTPTGYCVEVMDAILNKLEIPHRFEMRDWTKAIEAFESGQADMIHALDVVYDKPPYVQTQNFMTFYKIEVAYRDDTPPLRSLKQLTSEDTIVVKNNDYAAVYLNQQEFRPYHVRYENPHDALVALSNGEIKYYLWGSMPLRQEIQEMALDNVRTCDVDIPTGELHFTSTDKELINDIDEEFARMMQEGELEIISDKWFHPERIHDNTPRYVFFIIGLVVMLIIIFLILSQLLRRQIRKKAERTRDLGNIMAQALSMGSFYIFEHDLVSGQMKNVYGNLMPEEGMDVEEFFDQIAPSDVEHTRSVYGHLLKNVKQPYSTDYKWNGRQMNGYSIAEMEGGQLTHIINIVKDITREVEQDSANNELANRYSKIFHSNVIAMSFYDANGKLIDFNDSMRELCVFNDQMEAYFRNTCMFDAPALQNDFDRTSKHSFHVCQRMYYPEIGIDKYLDFRIRPTFDDQDHLLYYIVTSRDVTAEREMDLEQRKHEKKLKQISKRVSRYEHELNYLLKNGNMFVWSISFKTMEIIFSRSLSSYEFKESFEDYLNSMFGDERAAAAYNMKALMETRQPFNTIHHFLSTPIDNGPQWYAISGMPVMEDDGECTGYFGVLKNVNDLMTVQEQLKKERTRAEASGTMKSAFLANMTHEIRTPLNAIVGFSDLLQIIDEPADRQEFIRIIRNNCDMLLRLINDILEASDTGQTLAIAPTDVDFSQVFDDICQTLAQRVQEPGVEFLKENPYPTLNTTLDKGRVQQVITNFVTNAVKYTHEGHIKVGYRKQDEGLYIYCEDTGAGIPKDKQASVFERFVKLNDFVQGTGLGLSICKTIAERCNGKIGVFSEGEGKGSTFWLWIPCELNKD